MRGLIETMTVHTWTKNRSAFTIHQKNIQSLAIELFKVKQNISTHRMNNIFHMRDNLRYNLRSETEFLRSSANTNQYVLNSLREFSSKVLNMVANEIKIAEL